MKTEDLKLALESLPDTSKPVRDCLSTLAGLLENMRSRICRGMNGVDEPLDGLESLSRVKECLFILEELV